jgi:hypothetical protein
MANITIPNFNTQKTFAGLNTYTYTIQTAGMHTCRIKTDHHQASNLTSTISQSGSFSGTLTTGTVQPIATPNNTGQSSLILEARANCQPGDVITFTLTSSTANDQQLNTLKSNLIVTQGLAP